MPKDSKDNKVGQGWVPWACSYLLRMWGCGAPGERPEPSRHRFWSRSGKNAGIQKPKASGFRSLIQGILGSSMDPLRIFRLHVPLRPPGKISKFTPTAPQRCASNQVQSKAPKHRLRRSQSTHRRCSHLHKVPGDPRRLRVVADP